MKASEAIRSLDDKLLLEWGRCGEHLRGLIEKCVTDEDERFRFLMHWSTMKKNQGPDLR